MGILSKQGECVCWWRESNGACCRGRNSSRQSPIDRTETERTRTERRRSAQDGANSLDEMFGARRTGTGTVARLWALVVSWPSRSRPTSSRWSGRWSDGWTVAVRSWTEDRIKCQRGDAVSPSSASSNPQLVVGIGSKRYELAPVPHGCDTSFWPTSNWAPGCRIKRSTVMWANGRDAGEGVEFPSSPKSPGAQPLEPKLSR